MQTASFFLIFIAFTLWFTDFILLVWIDELTFSLCYNCKSLLSLFEKGYVNNNVSLSKIQMSNALFALFNDRLSKMEILVGINNYCLLSVDTHKESLDFIRTMTDSLWFSLVLCCQVWLSVHFTPAASLFMRAVRSLHRLHKVNSH